MANFRPPTHPFMSTWSLNAPLLFLMKAFDFYCSTWSKNGILYLTALAIFISIDVKAISVLFILKKNILLTCTVNFHTYIERERPSKYVRTFSKFLRKHIFNIECKRQSFGRNSVKMCPYGLLKQRPHLFLTFWLKE